MFERKGSPNIDRFFQNELFHEETQPYKRVEYIIKPGLKTLPVYDAYWIFAAKRQEIFFNRFEKKAAPWTDDPILQKYKFTNNNNKSWG